MILPVILCGGSGTRLWPLSRKSYPKQLLSLSGDNSLLQETAKRTKNIPNVSSPTIVCNDAYRFVIAEQLRAIGIENPTILLEPCPKNTAPAAAVAALTANSNDLILILPADHQIKNIPAFHDVVSKAKQMAEQGYLVTFGIQPERAETGYGYIKKGRQISEGVHIADAFVEKPAVETAEKYVASGEYYWNSGMFLFKAATYLEELAKFSPEILSACKLSLADSKNDLFFVKIAAAAFNNCPSDSIDYAVMEKSDKVAMVPLYQSGWSDLGSWDAVFDANTKDENNNVILGDVYAENVTNSYLHAQNRLLAVVGVSDHIVVETTDAVLVAHKDAAQDVKNIVSKLGLKKREEVDTHRRVYRPWGYYEILDVSANFQVKRIAVKPGAKLSLQMHNFRSEHWVVIKGVAEVTCGEQIFQLDQNQSTYIPLLAKHRLANPSDEELVIIEVQTGSYLGEDDIVRFDDHYGRDVLQAS